MITTQKPAIKTDSITAHKKGVNFIITHFALSIILITLSIPKILQAQEVRQIVFPIEGNVSFSDTFGDARSGGRTHEGIDIFAPKMTPLISAVNGYVSFQPQEEPSWGYGIFIRDEEGWQYRYLHVNNDTPGTDDGNGGTFYAYAPDILRGTRVTAGQLIGWAGDSGNAENVGSHLHFEIRQPDRTPINPYLSLINAARPGAFNPEGARLASTSIGIDKNLTAGASSPCTADTLIKGSGTAVYYCGIDGNRYVFPNQQTYLSWYSDFSSVVQITDEALGNIPLGGNVTYRPGTRMIKMQTSPKVYAVDKGGVLRYVTSPEIATSLYGTNWNKMIDDISDAFFVNYRMGDPITMPLEDNT